MRGTTHLILSTLIAYGVAMWLFTPLTSLPEIAIVSTFILFAAIGSIAPDADIKHSLIRGVLFIGFFAPFWLLALVPLSFIFDFHDEKLLTRINRALFKPKHRGVMHSLIGLGWSVVVVYFVMRYMTSYYPAIAAAEGFALGYLLHLIEDAAFTKTAIKPFVTDSFKIGG